MGSDPDADRRRYEALESSLTNHTPDREAVNDIEHIRELAKTLGAALIRLCPDGRERSLALTALEESVMWSVKSLVLPR